MTRKAGTVSSETRSCILSSALDEFYEHGFQGSSLRRIATDAGVTTGAIYCFYDGKEELFDSVLRTGIAPFTEYLVKHYQHEIESIRITGRRNKDDDYEVAESIINFYFKYRKVWDVFRKHLHHPVALKYAEELIELSTYHYMTMIRMLGNLSDEKTESYRFAITQFVHMQMETMTNLISQDFRKKEMLEHSWTSVKMLRGAFNALLED